MSKTVIVQEPNWKPAVPEDALHRTCELLPEETAEIIQWLYDHYLELRVSMNQLGKKVGMDGGNIAKIWKHADLEEAGRSYSGNLNAVAERLRHYRTEFELNNGIGQPDFLRTKYAGFIFNYCDQVANVGMIGRIYGDYGGGKTVALKQYASLQPRDVLYFECGESASFTVNLRDLSQRIGCSLSSNPQLMRERVYDALQRRRVRLLIIDELHAIFNWARSDKEVGPGQFCDLLRKVHDRLGIPIILCGTDVLPEKLEKGIYRRALEQLTDRGDVPLNLTGWEHPRDDLQAFYQFYGLPPKPPKEAQRIIDDVLSAFSLRKLVFKLRTGARGAKSMKKPYTWEHFIDAQDLSAALASNPLSTIQ